MLVQIVLYCGSITWMLMFLFHSLKLYHLTNNHIDKDVMNVQSKHISWHSGILVAETNQRCGWAWTIIFLKDIFDTHICFNERYVLRNKTLCRAQAPVTNSSVIAMTQNAVLVDVQQTAEDSDGEWHTPPSMIRNVRADVRACMHEWSQLHCNIVKFSVRIRWHAFPANGERQFLWMLAQQSRYCCARQTMTTIERGAIYGTRMSI